MSLPLPVLTQIPHSSDTSPSAGSSGQGGSPIVSPASHPTAPAAQRNTHPTAKRQDRTMLANLPRPLDQNSTSIHACRGGHLWAGGATIEADREPRGSGGDGGSDERADG